MILDVQGLVSNAINVYKIDPQIFADSYISNQDGRPQPRASERPGMYALSTVHAASYSFMREWTSRVQRLQGISGDMSGMLQTLSEHQKLPSRKPSQDFSVPL